MFAPLTASDRKECDVLMGSLKKVALSVWKFIIGCLKYVVLNILFYFFFWLTFSISGKLKFIPPFIFEASIYIAQPIFNIVLNVISHSIRRAKYDKITPENRSPEKNAHGFFNRFKQSFGISIIDVYPFLALISMSVYFYIYYLVSYGLGALFLDDFATLFLIYACIYAAYTIVKYIVLYIIRRRQSSK